MLLGANHATRASGARRLPRRSCSRVNIVMISSLASSPNVSACLWRCEDVFCCLSLRPAEYQFARGCTNRAALRLWEDVVLPSARFRQLEPLLNGTSKAHSRKVFLGVHACAKQTPTRITLGVRFGFSCGGCTLQSAFRQLCIPVQLFENAVVPYEPSLHKGAF